VTIIDNARQRRRTHSHAPEPLRGRRDDGRARACAMLGGGVVVPVEQRI
jgi:hypothetical protein